MARDYKNVTEVAAKKTTRGKTKKIASSEKNLPGWVWLVSGVVIGGFVSFIVYLKLNVPIEATPNAAVVEQKINVEKKPLAEKTEIKPVAEKAEQKKQDDGELEFYKVLTNRAPLFPSNEISEKDQGEKPGSEGVQKQNSTAANVEAAKPTIKPVANNVQPSKVRYFYTLQIGSFLAFKDADKRKANLAMLGIGSRIHAVKARNVTHYRVMVGPYDDLKRIKKIDAEMQANNIKTLLLRERG